MNLTRIAFKSGGYRFQGIVLGVPGRFAVVLTSLHSRNTHLYYLRITVVFTAAHLGIRMLTAASVMQCDFVGPLR